MSTTCAVMTARPGYFFFFFSLSRSLPDTDRESYLSFVLFINVFVVTNSPQLKGNFIYLILKF